MFRMLKDMKLGAKIGGGFAIVLVLLAVVAFTGYRGLTGVEDRVGKADDVNRLIKEILETRQQEKNFIIRGDNKYIDMVKENVITLKNQTNETKEKFKDPENKQQMEDVLAAVENYEKAFSGYVDLKEETKKLSDVWRKLGEDFVLISAKIMDETVDPALEKAWTSQDVEAIGKWSKIDMIFNESIRQNFLLLRINAIYYLMKKTPEQWDNFQKAGKTLAEGMETWRKIVQGHKDLVEEVQKLEAGVAQYVETGMKCHDLFEKENKMDMEMVAAARATHEVCNKTRADQKAKMEREISSANSIMIIGSIIAILMGSLLAFFIARGITMPISRSVDFAKKMSEGDFTGKLDIDQKDEIGVLANALNNMVSDLGQMFKDIAAGVETLSSSSTELSAISQQMSSGSEQTSGKANTVATAAEEMSSNMTSVAAATEEASTNVGMVATAAEEMTAVINEIAQNTEKAQVITGEAVSEAKSASDKVDELGKAAQDIGKVTETITEISEQTNLLALNATIEAARAGEAGKGFAVVANEIKELAKQTSEATNEIKNRITSIQNSTKGTVTQIEQISKVVNDVNEIVSTITTAVEEQSVTTKEIANNVVQASQGIAEVTENVAQSSTVAGEIAKDITEVNQAASEISNSSSQVNMSAEELSKLAEQLKEMVGRFKV